MGKPSVTNTLAPSKTTLWAPARTSWDLNNDGHWTEAQSLGLAANNTDVNFANLVAAISAPALQPTGMPALDTVDYVFYGVNGGYDETVVGKQDAKGLLVTGNGKDSVTGGDLDDIIMTGNGKDTAHGGGGNDIIYGENGADELHGDSDNGHALYVAPTEGETVLTIKDDADVWAADPNGISVATAIPNKTTVSKDGFFIALDDDGHPTEFDANGNPVVHVVFSVTPETTGWYTLVFNQGNQLDGTGNPDFAGSSDQTQVFLTAGQKYYYSFIYDPGHSTVRVDVFEGQVDITSPINDGPNGNPDSVATSQGLPADSWETFFDITTDGGSEGVQEFTAGDVLIGGNGPDNFVWDANDLVNVDLILDYNQSSGALDPLEGDILTLIDVFPGLTDANDDGLIDKYDLTTFLQDLDGVDQDNDGNFADDLVIYVGEDQAIGLAGISNLSQVTINFEDTPDNGTTLTG